MVAIVRKELIKAVAARTGYTIAVADEIVRATFEVITDELAAHGYVGITNFGTFSVEDMNKRTYIHPRTREKIHVDNHKYPKFKASPVLKDVVK